MTSDPLDDDRVYEVGVALVVGYLPSTGRVYFVNGTTVGDLDCLAFSFTD